MLFYNSRLHLFLGKLKSKWSGSFLVKKYIYPYGAAYIKNPRKCVTFKVSGQKLKPYLEYQSCEEDTEINLNDPPIIN